MICTPQLLKSVVKIKRNALKCRQTKTQTTATLYSLVESPCESGRAGYNIRTIPGRGAWCTNELSVVGDTLGNPPTCLLHNILNTRSYLIVKHTLFGQYDDRDTVVMAECSRSDVSESDQDSSTSEENGMDNYVAKQLASCTTCYH